MNAELTPREHDDMRNLLLAGSQRIRPAGTRRALIAAVVAVVLVAGTVGGITLAALSAQPEKHSPAQIQPTPTVTSGPWPTIFSAPSPSPLPSTGTHVTLQPIPELDKRLVVGTSEWLDEHGIDIRRIQGYQSSHGIEPWTADLKDGSGRCILIRRDPGGTGGWSEIVCDGNGVPAWVDREVDGAVVRFTIAGDAVDAYIVHR